MRGVSPLIAVVLLIVIVISIAATVMSWASTFATSTTRTVTNKSDTAISCSSANVIIDEVFVILGNNTGSARAIVKNVGSIDDMTIQSAQLYNRTGANFSASGMPVSDFDVGKIVTIQFNNINMPTCGDFAQVTVATGCGGVTDTFDKSPKCI